MSAKRYVVTLLEEEHAYLHELVSKGKRSARMVIGASVLLKAEAGWTDEQIAQAFPVSVRSVERLRKRCVEEGVEAALRRKEQQHRKAHTLDGTGEARLITLACSKPPDGYARWTLRLLADQLVELEVVKGISHETVRQTLKKTISSRGRNGSGALLTAPAPSLSVPWKTFWRSTTDLTTQHVR